MEVLPYISDIVRNTRYLLDTGAVTSLLPKQKGDEKHLDHKLYFKAANGETVQTYGTKLVTLQFPQGIEIHWIFTVADVQQPILGMDFIQHHNLILHPRRKRVIFYNKGKTLYLNLCEKPKGLPVQALEMTVPPEVDEILSRYPDLTNTSDKLQTPKHRFVHKIIVEGEPITDRPRRFSPEKQRELDIALEKMVRDGILVKGNSQWLSHPHLVRKRSGDYRVTVDFRRLNERIKPDGFPLPLLRSFADNIYGATIFSALDIKDAFYNIPLTTDSRDYTAFVTHNNIYKFLRLSMGLKSSPTVFQKIFAQIMENIRTPSGRLVPVFIYIDDVLITSKTREEAVEDLTAVLHRLHNNGFRINKGKCRFLQQELQFLGHRISATGISPLPEKVDAIKSFPRPERLKQLRRFLGMINFYHSFCKNLARITAPLSHLLGGEQNSKKANPKIKWTDETIKAFEDSRDALSKKTMLAYRDPSAETAIFSDASSTAIGATLQQNINGVWQPLAFFSRKLSSTERKYSTFGRELLGIYAAVKHFRIQIEGRPFHIMTDHKPLCHSMQKKGVRDLNREERQLQYISAFTTDIRHIKGADNVVADALSRRLEEYVVQGESENADEADISPIYFPPAMPNNINDTGTIPRQVQYTPQHVAEWVYLPQHCISEATINTSSNNGQRSSTVDINQQYVTPKDAHGSADEYVLPQESSSAKQSIGPSNQTADHDLLTHCLIAAMSKATADASVIKNVTDETKHRLMREQRSCPQLQAILAGTLRFTPELSLHDGIYYNDINGVRRIYLPQSMRDELFHKFHSHAHPGINSAIRYFTRLYVYPDMRRHITQLTRLCPICPKVKIHKHNVARIGTYGESSGRFKNLHADLYGPFPDNHGFKYLFTCIDRYTRYPVAVPLADTKTDTVLDAFLLHVVAHFGAPDTLVTDRGAQFTSEKWSDLMDSLHVKHYTTCSYTPKTNAAIERFHRTLNAAIKAHAQLNEQIWLPKLPYILLAIRNTIDPDTNISPAQAVYGQSMPLPGDLLPPYESTQKFAVSDFTRKLQKCMQFIPERLSRPAPSIQKFDRRLSCCTHVYVRAENRKKIQNHYTGPYKVLHRGATYFKLELPNGPDNVSIDRLKAAWTRDDYLERPQPTSAYDNYDDPDITPVPVLYAPAPPTPPPRPPPHMPPPHPPQGTAPKVYRQLHSRQVTGKNVEHSYNRPTQQHRHPVSSRHSFPQMRPSKQVSLRGDPRSNEHKRVSQPGNARTHAPVRGHVQPTVPTYAQATATAAGARPRQVVPPPQQPLQARATPSASASAPANPASDTQATRTSRSGRVIKPPQRYGFTDLFRRSQK